MTSCWHNAEGHASECNTKSQILGITPKLGQLVPTWLNLLTMFLGVVWPGWALTRTIPELFLVQLAGHLR